jgi:hypothetical protein
MVDESDSQRDRLEEVDDTLPFEETDMAPNEFDTNRMKSPPV